MVGAVAFAAAATVLSSTFDWPDILREPAGVVLPAFVAGGTSLVWTWFATAWTYAILAVPILLLPAVLGRRDDPALRVATYVGATSVLLSLIGFLRWVFVVPPLARLLRHRRPRHPGRGGRRLDRPTPVRRRAAGRAPGPAARHRLVGHPQRDHPAQPGAAPLARRHRARRQRALPDSTRATSSPPPCPASRSGTSAGLLGSTGWGLWVAALGVTLLLRPIRTPSRATVQRRGADVPSGEHARHTTPATAGPRS